ncbi:MAG: hypothetical protein C0177_00495 [Fervidicoccus fontis]|nr:MAG: hypothetical protein C0177_00495 [Fervidicoccus fontis]
MYNKPYFFISKMYVEHQETPYIPPKIPPKGKIKILENQAFALKLVKRMTENLKSGHSDHYVQK